MGMFLAIDGQKRLFFDFVRVMGTKNFDGILM